ncbi:alpha/beta fold hydrolase [Cupriavidus taiwanensis]|uniref:alpha/beta fold hydrolase n=1 Tax=Cupriavidus taiwanensis TaxID=164546 RepID=UPI000E109AC6|nr:alpha/beta hydrolase [Cupriavidus taiwanensis]SPA55833.1 putative hydrolase or acyltransferase [Cupriavidus taiwanensis]
MSTSNSKSRASSKGVFATLASVAAAAGTAAWVHHRARQAERDHPPQGSFLTVDGVQLHYIDEGEGPAVVLLHGNAVLLQDYVASGLLRSLSRRHRVILFDRPGFGHSQRPRDRRWTPRAQAALLRKALAQLGVERPLVVGHSLGTLVALGMALESTVDVRGLVLISGYYYPSARVDVLLTSPAAIPVVGDALRYTVAPLAGRLLLKRALRQMFAPAQTPPIFFDLISREMLLRPSQINAAAEDAAFMIPAVSEFRELYAGLQVPVTLVAGAGDKMVDAASHSTALHRELPNSTLVLVPGVGHMVHYAATEDIARTVERMTGASGAPFIQSVQ